MTRRPITIIDERPEPRLLPHLDVCDAIRELGLDGKIGLTIAHDHDCPAVAYGADRWQEGLAACTCTDQFPVIRVHSVERVQGYGTQETKQWVRWLPAKAAVGNP